MIEKGSKIEISGLVTDDSDPGQFTLSMKEIFVDGQWRRFEPEKSLIVAKSDYNTSLTQQELELVKLLAEKSKDNKGMTPDQVVLAESIVAKLGDK